MSGCLDNGGGVTNVRRGEEGDQNKKNLKTHTHTHTHTHTPPLPETYATK
jgi:hypothetical protein